MEGKDCFLCQTQADITCDKCDIWSCCASHLKIHKSSTHGCLPFGIVYKEGIGNCCVATRDILPGHTVLVDTPAVWGPNSNTAPKCVACLAAWSGNNLCKQCGYPVCDQACAEGGQHAIECGVLVGAQEKPVFSPEDKLCPPMIAVNVIRLLTLGCKDHELYVRSWDLMDHASDVLEDPYLKVL